MVLSQVGQLRQSPRTTDRRFTPMAQTSAEHRDADQSTDLRSQQAPAAREVGVGVDPLEASSPGRDVPLNALNGHRRRRSEPNEQEDGDDCVALKPAAVDGTYVAVAVAATRPDQ